MNDIDNNSGYPEQDKEHTNEDISAQNTEQSNQSEGDSTYWESNQWNDPYETANKVDTDPANLNQGTPNVTYEEFNSNQNKSPQKKSGAKKGFLAAAIILVVLLAGAAAAYAFSGTVRNSVALLLKSPRDYYAYIENKSIGSSADKMTAYMNMSGVNKDNATSVSAKLSYDKATVGAMLQGVTGMSISDLEASIGMSLDSIGFDVLSAKKDQETYGKIGLNLNNIDIISAELFMDFAAKEMFIHLPDLSPAYLKQSLDMEEYMSEDFSLESLNEFTALLSSEKTGEFIKRYTALITDQIKDVELSKGENIAVKDVSVKANLLTITLNYEDFSDILRTVLKEAKDDEYIMDLLRIFNISKEDYEEEIDYALEELDDMDNDPDFTAAYKDSKLVMKVYVGNDGNIIGRKLDIHNPEVTHTISFFNVEKNNKGAYKFNFHEEDWSTDITVTGSHSIDKDAYTGSAVVDIVSDDVEVPQLSFKLDYEGLKTVIKNDRIYSYGRMTLSSHAMMGMELAFEYDVKDDAQLVTLKLNMGSSSLVTLETSTKYLKDFVIPEPDKNAEVFDMTDEIDAYSYTIDTEKFISNLSQKLGVNLEDLLGNMLPFYY